MKNTSKWIISGVVVALVGAGIYFGNTKLQKGNLGFFDAGSKLSITKDVISDVKTSQVITGTTNVVFGAFKFQNDSNEEITIRKIRVRNLGTNTDGISNIGIYDGNKLLNDNILTAQNEGTIVASLGADGYGDPKATTFNYSSNPIVISKNTSRVFTIKAYTVYNATSGQTVQFSIESIEKFNGKNSRPTTIDVKVDETAVKYLYPTKLNFAWVASPSKTIHKGKQIKVAEFKIGADAANVNNAGAYITLENLNLTNVSTAELSNFTLKDVTFNTNIIINSPTTNFDTAGAGWEVGFQQGEQRTFQLFADVNKTANNQVVVFKFFGGNPAKTGSALWTAINMQSAVTVGWTVGAYDTESPALIVP